MYKYSIVTYNFNNYEILREVVNPDPDVEYVYVTDDERTASSTGKVVIDHKLDGMSPFDKAFYVRYHLFEYASCNICVRIDGSIQIVGSLDRLVDEFEVGNYDACVMVHPGRDNLFDEYVAGVSKRNYPLDRANTIINKVNIMNYDVKNHKGLYQLCFSINRKSKITDDIDRMTYAYLKYLGDNEIERLDQTIFSFILNKYFNNINVMPVSQRILDSDMLKMYNHNTDDQFHWNGDKVKYKDSGYLFNKETNLIY